MGLIDFPSVVTVVHKLDPDTKAFLQSLFQPLSTIQSQLSEVLTNQERLMANEKDIADEERIIEADVVALQAAIPGIVQAQKDSAAQIADLQNQIATLKASGQDTTLLDSILAGMQGVHTSLTAATSALTPSTSGSLVGDAGPASTSSPAPSGESQVP